MKAKDITEDQRFFWAVKKWIATTQNPEQLENIKNFIQSSHATHQTKQKLFAIADGRHADIDNKPCVAVVDGIAYMSDNDFNIKDFKTRFSAICSMIPLIFKGYDVYLTETSTGYKISCNVETPVHHG